MNKSQLQWLLEYKVPDNKLITIADLDNKAPRTLLYGYTVDRLTHHVYISERGAIETVVYGIDAPLYRLTPTRNEHYVPNKRLYPARCDFWFCKKLAEAGINLPFTTYSEVPLEGAYYGRCYEGID